KSLGRLTPVDFENIIFETGKQSDGEKSATEIKKLDAWRVSALQAEGKQSSGSNSALEFKKPKCLTCQKRSTSFRH
ncbi:MAG: hypothetical protein R6U64_06290, partial [Bacteroidales bacterium]